MSRWRLPLVGALAVSTALTPLAPVAAAPAAMPPSLAKADTGSLVTQVRRGRSFHRHHHHGHRHHGRGVGIGLGIGIIGGIIAAETLRPGPGYYYDDTEYDGPYSIPPDYTGDPRQLCAQRFRSFEWSTGLYTTYSGEKRLCPYLR